jgi:hypothetical protein
MKTAYRCPAAQDGMECGQASLRRIHVKIGSYNHFSMDIRRCPIGILHEKFSVCMSRGDLFSGAKILPARNQHKDVVRRAGNFRIDS